MKTLVISDIHGSYKRLEEVLNTPLIYDQIILVGDLMYHGPRNPILEDYNPSKVADLLNKVSVPIIAVRGNCDSEVDQMLIDFPIMADNARLVLDDVSIYVSHGHLEDPDLDAHKVNSSLYISGHTHVLRLEMNGTTLMINPGSISLPKENNPATYGYIDGHSISILTLDHKVFKEITL